MPLYRYYFSPSPGDAAPADGDLSRIEADSRAHALATLLRDGRLPLDWPTLWVHFLIWVDREGQQRGFESVPMSRFAPPDS